MASCYCGTINCEGEKCNADAYKLGQAALKVKELETRINVIDELNEWLKHESQRLNNIDELEQATSKIEDLESKLKYAQTRVKMFEAMWI